VGLTGVLPVVACGVVAVEVMRRHAEVASVEALRGGAELAAARVDGYLVSQEQAIRVAAAAAGDAPGRLAEVAGEVPALRGVVPLAPGRGPAAPLRLDAGALERVRAGEEVRSRPYPGADGAPVLDVCVPGASRGSGICATVDLGALWPLLARMRVAQTGQVLAFDGDGRLLARSDAGLEPGAAAGAPWPGAARFGAGAGGPPERWRTAAGMDVLAGWARVPSLGWTVAVARPWADALRTARAAQWGLAVVACFALAASLAIGLSRSRRVLGDLAADERWRLAGRIAAGVSHDLGHRVAILQHLARLADEAEPAQFPRIRDTLRAEVATLRKFVADFSDLSRDVTVDALPVDLDAFAASVVRTASAQAEAAGVRLRALPLGGGAWAMTDRHLLERAVLNLLWNAFEASATGAEVRVRVVADRRQVALAVEDDGAGLAPERLPGLFDGFASTKRSGGHVGFGLANVKRIARLLGAALGVESAPGNGTAFRLALPRAPAPVDDG
jgi:signal transduction histidine kinase